MVEAFQPPHSANRHDAGGRGVRGGRVGGLITDSRQQSGTFQGQSIGRKVVAVAYRLALLP
jgi:hypothetical protein